MKKMIIILAVLFTLCGCTETRNYTEETDYIPDETITAVSEIPFAPETANITALVIDMDGEAYGDLNISAYSSLERVEIHNCGSKRPDFLKDSGIGTLILYDFTGQAADYEELLGSLEQLDYLYIYTDVCSEEDRELFLSYKPDLRVFIYSDEPVVYIGGEYIPVTDGLLFLEGDVTAAEDLENIAHYGGIRDISLYDFKGDEDTLAQIVSRMPLLESVTVYTSSFSYEASEKLMHANSNCAVAYCDMTGTAEVSRESGFEFYVYPFVEPFNEPEVLARELKAFFSNYTDDPQTVDGLKIYRENNDEWEQMSFTDGSDYLPIGLEISPHTVAEYGYYESDWSLTEDMFAFTSAAPGRYKAVFTMSGEEKEMEFVIGNLTFYDAEGAGYISGAADHLDFLDDEQKSAFNEAYASIVYLEFGFIRDINEEEYVSSHTADDYINDFLGGLTYDYAYQTARDNMIIDENGDLLRVRSGDRGSKIDNAGACFVPVYMNENEVMLKNINVCWHGDSPYRVRYDEYNYHMVKTADGWKFDVFQIWY